MVDFFMSMSSLSLSLDPNHPLPSFAFLSNSAGTCTIARDELWRTEQDTGLVGTNLVERWSASAVQCPSVCPRIDLKTTRKPGHSRHVSPYRVPVRSPVAPCHPCGRPCAA